MGTLFHTIVSLSSSSYFSRALPHLMVYRYFHFRRHSFQVSSFTCISPFNPPHPTRGVFYILLILLTGLNSELLNYHFPPVNRNTPSLLPTMTEGFYQFDMTKPKLDLRTSKDVK